MTGRLAPTPSGRMHPGNVMAMLAAWLSARSRGGRLLLRIEDLDRARAIPDGDRLVMDDLHWLGLGWDGEPVYQSARAGRYVEALRSLESLPAPRGVGLASAVYPCFCSRGDIRAATAPQEGDGFVVYPGTCRGLGEGDPDLVVRRVRDGERHSLRLAMPLPGNPGDSVVVDDEVFGRRRFLLPRDLGDPVMRRADGVVSYQLAVVVDDLDMGVDDVVRGRDLLRSAALQTYVRGSLRAAGFARARTKRGASGVLASREPSSASSPSDVRRKRGGFHVSAVSPWTPRYAHLPLLDGASGRRLAKRERSLDMGAIRAAGVRSEQVIGYCAWLLGIRVPADGPVGGRGGGKGPCAREAGNSAGPVPLSPDEALELFSWDGLRRDVSDRRLPTDAIGFLRRL
ncbi:glutamate--tRNA ligase family protein [uncultured Bifidobacterium sp.]|uniref:glutamate--tRNA ligase family protein n=1 Tax=uncultured Bifidobacterium sp. TaxID=165187 RepID=UPI0028DCB8FC|nr:glutamate--tRNA ligase family protein [uncultured Bifidobacterium sp.]